MFRRFSSPLFLCKVNLFSNGGLDQPQPEDLLVFGPSLFNRYGHVAIIAQVGQASIEIAQQNPGPYGSSREHLPLAQHQGRWSIDHPRVLGWLRLVPSEDPEVKVTASPATL